MPDDPSQTTETEVDARLREGLSKSGVLWLGPSETDARAAWFAYVAPHVYVVTGPGEQPLPELHDETVLVLRSRATRDRLLVLPAGVEVLHPTDERWEPATTALAAARLNAPVLPAQLPDRWAASATVYALTPDPQRAHR